MGLKLREYAWDGNNWKDTGHDFEFDPNPNSVSKETKIEWRERHSGLYSLYPKCKYRYRRTVTFTIRGGCNGDKRREMEFYAMRNSKFKMDNTSWGDLHSPEYYSERTVYPYNYAWTGESHPKQTLYLMWTEFSSDEAEGKVDWYTYQLKLQVVDNLLITS